MAAAAAATGAAAAEAAWSAGAHASAAWSTAKNGGRSESVTNVAKYGAACLTHTRSTLDRDRYVPQAHGSNTSLTPVSIHAAA